MKTDEKMKVNVEGRMLEKTQSGVGKGLHDFS